MGNKNSGKHIYKIDENFFSIWTSQMAYVFGFTCADGNIHERTLSWDLSNNSESNFEILKSFNLAMRSNYPINIRRQSYRLRVSNYNLLKDIKNLGIIPNKSKILSYPFVPDEYLAHFLRGFLDGDGWVVTRVRKTGGKEICVGFCNGSYDFMKGLIDSLRRALKLNSFNLRKRIKITKNGNQSFCYQIEFYSDNANRILDFLYCNLNEHDLFLKRKYEKFIEAKRFFQEEEISKSFGRKALRLKETFKEDPKEIIKRLFSKEDLLPRKIASKLGISLSTLYRWMDKYEIRKFSERGSNEWLKRIIKSRGVN